MKDKRKRKAKFEEDVHGVPVAELEAAGIDPQAYADMPNWGDKERAFYWERQFRRLAAAGKGTRGPAAKSTRAATKSTGSRKMAGPLKRTPFAERVIARRAGRPLRDVQYESKVSKDTIWRIEQGYLPDLKVTLRLCRWLDLDLETAIREMGLLEELGINDLRMTQGN